MTWKMGGRKNDPFLGDRAQKMRAVAHEHLLWPLPFIRELLQNSDDSESKNVCFVFTDEGFWVTNDGIPFNSNYEKLIIEGGEVHHYLGGDSDRMLDSQHGKLKHGRRVMTGGHQTGFLHYMRFTDAYKLHYYQVVNQDADVLDENEAPTIDQAEYPREVTIGQGIHTHHDRDATWDTHDGFETPLFGDLGKNLMQSGVLFHFPWRTTPMKDTGSDVYEYAKNLGGDSEKEFPTYTADDISRLADITCSQAPLLMLHLRNVNRISVARSSTSAAWMKTWEFKQGTLAAQIVQESPAEWKTDADFAWKTFREWYRNHNFAKDANGTWKFTSVRQDVAYDGDEVLKSSHVTALVPEFDWTDFIAALSQGMPSIEGSIPPGPWAYSILPLSVHFQGAAPLFSGDFFVLEDRKTTESASQSRLDKKDWNLAVAREILSLSVELQGKLSSEEALGEIARMARVPVDVADMLGRIAVPLDYGGQDKPREDFSKTTAWTAEYLLDRSGTSCSPESLLIPEKDGQYDAPLSEALSSLGLHVISRAVFDLLDGQHLNKKFIEFWKGECSTAQTTDKTRRRIRAAIMNHSDALADVSEEAKLAIAAFAFDNDLADMPVFPDANGSMRPLNDFQTLPKVLIPNAPVLLPDRPGLHPSLEEKITPDEMDIFSLLESIDRQFGEEVELTDDTQLAGLSALATYLAGQKPEERDEARRFRFIPVVLRGKVFLSRLPHITTHHCSKNKREKVNLPQHQPGRHESCPFCGVDIKTLPYKDGQSTFTLTTPEKWGKASTVDRNDAQNWNRIYDYDSALEYGWLDDLLIQPYDKIKGTNNLKFGSITQTNAGMLCFGSGSEKLSKDSGYFASIYDPDEFETMAGRAPTRDERFKLISLGGNWGKTDRMPRLQFICEHPYILGKDGAWRPPREFSLGITDKSAENIIHETTDKVLREVHPDLLGEGIGEVFLKNMGVAEGLPWEDISACIMALLKKPASEERNASLASMFMNAMRNDNTRGELKDSLLFSERWVPLEHAASGLEDLVSPGNLPLPGEKFSELWGDDRKHPVLNIEWLPRFTDDDIAALQERKADLRKDGFCKESEPRPEVLAPLFHQKRVVVTLSRRLYSHMLNIWPDSAPGYLPFQDEMVPFSKFETLQYVPKEADLVHVEDKARFVALDQLTEIQKEMFKRYAKPYQPLDYLFKNDAEENLSHLRYLLNDNQTDSARIRSYMIGAEDRHIYLKSKEFESGPLFLFQHRDLPKESSKLRFDDRIFTEISQIPTRFGLSKKEIKRFEECFSEVIPGLDDDVARGSGQLTLGTKTTDHVLACAWNSAVLSNETLSTKCRLPLFQTVPSDGRNQVEYVLSDKKVEFWFDPTENRDGKHQNHIGLVKTFIRNFPSATESFLPMTDPSDDVGYRYDLLHDQVISNQISEKGPVRLATAERYLNDFGALVECISGRKGIKKEFSNIRCMYYDPPPKTQTVLDLPSRQYVLKSEVNSNPVYPKSSDDALVVSWTSHSPDENQDVTKFVKTMYNIVHKRMDLKPAIGSKVSAAIDYLSSANVLRRPRAWEGDFGTWNPTKADFTDAFHLNQDYANSRQRIRSTYDACQLCKQKTPADPGIENSTEEGVYKITGQRTAHRPVEGEWAARQSGWGNMLYLCPTHQYNVQKKCLEIRVPEPDGKMKSISSFNTGGLSQEKLLEIASKFTIHVWRHSNWSSDWDWVKYTPCSIHEEWDVESNFFIDKEHKEAMIHVIAQYLSNK